MTPELTSALIGVLIALPGLITALTAYYKSKSAHQRIDTITKNQGNGNAP